MTLLAERSTAVAWTAPVANRPMLVDLSDRLERLTVTLASWQRTINTIVDLRTPTADEVTETGGTTRRSRYERRSAGLPRLGNRAAGIHAQMSKLRVPQSARAARSKA